MPFVGEDESRPAAAGHRNVGLVGQKVFPLLFALVGVERLGTLDHDTAADRVFTFLVEGEDLIGDAADGHFGGDGLPDELLHEMRLLSIN